MRKIILDTETTGLIPEKNKIIEIAMIELKENNELSGRFFHSYLNPKAPIPWMASKVHKISWHTVKNAPTFDDIRKDLEEFIANKEIISFYLPFNMKILNYNLGYELPNATLDLLKLSKEKFSLQLCSLPRLVKKLKIKPIQLFNNPLWQDCQTAYEIYQRAMKGFDRTNSQV